VRVVVQLKIGGKAIFTNGTKEVVIYLLPTHKQTMPLVSDTPQTYRDHSLTFPVT